VEKMTWIAEMFDRMSGPAGRIRNRLLAMHNAIGNTSSGFGKFAKDQELAGSKAMLLGSALGWLTKGAAIAGAAFVATGVLIGKTAFENFAFKESALATGKALWGSAEAADEMFKKASALARLTPFNVKEVAGAFNKLGAAGFGMEEVPVVFQGLSDIAAMSGRGAEAIGSLTLAFSQVMGKGHLAGQELNQITEAAGGAVSRMKLFGEIAKIMGVAESSIDSMMQNGLVPARVAIMGVMNVAKGLGGGVIGQNSIEQSKTLGGLWSNLEDTITNLWLTMDISNAPWFKTVKGVMSNIIDALDTSTDSGKRFQAVFDRMFAATIGRFEDWDGVGGLERMISMLEVGGRIFGHLWDAGLAVFGGFWDGLKVGIGPLMQINEQLGGTESLAWSLGGVFQFLGKIVGYLALGFGTLVAVFGPAVSFFARFVSLVVKLVEVVAGGVLEGLMHLFTGNLYWSTMKDIGKDMGKGLDQGFSDFLEIRSPSRVFQDHGENVIKGFNEGTERVPGMDGQLAADLAAGATGRGGGSAGGGVNVELTIHVNAGMGADADSIAQKLREMLPSTIAGIFDQLATERGLTT